MIYGTPELAYGLASSIGKNEIAALGANGDDPMGVAGYRFAHVKRAFRFRAVVVGKLEELPFVFPAAVAIGSLIMIGITLFKDWPQ
ncbi:hypothetical protein JQ628_23605 [Bradyrhizobium lablabi]|uniref:hypothetical protein n=1 Tax=Bradyrhizobium lablabi TaxID=722472 RepID=UPI001BAD120F|nr:hypothetical protein [Bradyrhizobium lablabi]MBR1124531.1 hypothetical protein [Bradyrhizobium lablabi]